MDILQAIAIVGAGFGTVLLAFGEMWRRQNSRLKNLETEKARADGAVREERDKLKGRVSDLEVKLQSQATEINNLRTQLNTVCRQLEDNQARLEKAESWGETKEAEAARWKTDADQLRAENVKQAARIRELEIETKTYQSALALIGDKLGKSAEQPEQSAEKTADNTEKENV